ncbi:MAG: tRNA 2-thiouridine(34) synthase MnmA [bacterium]
MNKENKKTAYGERGRTIFVGMSGGVDSSVSAALLKEQGYSVVGVFIRTWHPDFLACNEEEERRDAMRVCAHLDIPFLTFDFEEVYKKEVADYMIREYKEGRTPNPDVMCNKYVKFGAFLEKSLSMGADYVATGHYSINKLRITNYELRKGLDSSKDQSYFLWTLKQEQLSKILFPIGHLKKTEVRRLAKKFKLPVAEKKDSQGICFLGAVDLKDFLKHYIKEKKGKVLNRDGEEVGYHGGVVFFTLGERHGFTITKKNSDDTPYYVIDKNIKKNILYVSKDKNSLENNFFSSSFELNNTNWINKFPNMNKEYTAQIRYHGELLHCKINMKNKTKVEIIFAKPTQIASGQSVVIYDGDICIGGGVIV